MKKNVGNIDRIIRVILAVALLVVGLMSGSWLKYVFYALAVILVLTALVGICPLYSLIKIDTRGKSKK